MSHPTASSVLVTAIRGDDVAVPVELYEDDGQTTSTDVTAWTFRAQLRVDPDDATVTETWSVVVLDAVNGSLELRLTAAQTAAMDAGMFHWDLEGTGPEGVTTLVPNGRLRLKRDVTR